MAFFYPFTMFDLIVFPYDKGCDMAFVRTTLALESEDSPPLLLLLQATVKMKVCTTHALRPVISGVHEPLRRYWI